jgi:serine protease
MFKRVVTSAVAAALCLTGGAWATQAQAAALPARHAGLAGVPQVNLHRAFEAQRSHVTLHKIAGIAYPLGHAPATHAPAATAATCTEPNCPVVWNLGPVQHTPQVFLILWGPNWQTDPNQEASANYLISFFKGLGQQPDDNWSAITAQYNDPKGFPAETGSVYMGAWNDTSTPPTGVTQSGLASEANTWGAFLSSHGFTIGNNSQIVIATQSGTCPQGYFAPVVCGSNANDNYCAYHSFSNEPWINLPYQIDAGKFCGENFVNAGPAGTDDGWSIVGGHEYAEAITDPNPNIGWWDPNDGFGGEIADKCAFGGEAWNQNPPDPSGNVTLATGSFAMQSLWSNAASACVMSASGEDTVTVTNPGNKSSYAQATVSRQLTATSSGGNTLEWSATGLPPGLSISSAGLITGAPTTPGTYPVSAGAGDHTGAGASVSFTWKVRSDVGLPVTEATTGVCLNDNGSSVAAGTPVTVAACNGSGAQQWDYLSSGNLRVFGMCLTDPKAGAGKLVIARCTGATSQSWSHNESGEFFLASNGLCLTDPGNSTTTGTQVKAAKCTAAASQKWS